MMDNVQTIEKEQEYMCGVRLLTGEELIEIVKSCNDKTAEVTLMRIDTNLGRIAKSLDRISKKYTIVPPRVHVE